MELQDYEKKHISYLEENAHESTLFLKRNNDFPLKEPCRVALFGNGARKTVKGGTGSGDVASRFFVNCENGLKAAGFTITSEKWLDQYDEFRKSTYRDYVKSTKKLARKNYTFPGMFCMGFFEEEKNYAFEPEADGDACVYVLARNSGEGNDRRLIKGDIRLSDREVKDILFLNGKFQKFILVLNVGGVVDLTPVLQVSNILYLSQLGVPTGSVLADILLGKKNPSGKLTTTWAAPDDYPFMNEFGDLDDTYYKEGIYVGYRYFDSVKKKPMFPFGFGLSYTDFEIIPLDSVINGDIITLSAKVKNIGNYPGKEVIQAYACPPKGRLNKAFQVLVGFRKTRLLDPGEEEIVSVSSSLRDCASYDEKTSSWILEKGKYVFRLGNSSRNVKGMCFVFLKDDITTEKLENKAGECGFTDYSVPLEETGTDGLPGLDFSPDSVPSRTIVYGKDAYTDPLIEKFTDEELILLTVGAHKEGKGSIVGASAQRVIGGAGETCTAIPAIRESLSMADGPAGLRLTQVYGTDDKGTFNVSNDPINEKMLDFLPAFVRPFMKPPKRTPKELHYQYTTAIPIGTALAQSFNADYLEGLGRLVGEEMEAFDVDLWLAPALNIQRNIRCGRNFEYYSEDPLVSGFCAAAIARGVQSIPGKGVTIKHFCCNNQELNRFVNNSHVSEQAFREIYIRGFRKCIEESHPLAIMTSYNLVNGVHTSESYPIVNDVLRCEFRYDGLIMTDWTMGGMSLVYKKKHRSTIAYAHIRAGNDLTMGGTKADVRQIRRGLRKKLITRQDLVHSASRIYRSILRQRKG